MRLIVCALPVPLLSSSSLSGGDWGVAGDSDSVMPAASSPVLTRQQSYLVLDHESLTDRQESLIRQTAEVLFVTMAEAGCLLRHYGWKARKLQQEWFEDQVGRHARRQT
jgi:hypothetical protein